ncbi:MAG TPA: succinyl-diaminopimelate desuccinylase [Steroidobacteraceae bacterium]|jgi:succinyl-diaminopimelate desuccinylase|nr:succinyl-diaminopimelate desuccinylase [Steroidobacteraceae bacterium]
MSKTLELTQELISRASVSPTDGGCQAVMIERLEAIGFEVENLRFGPVDNFWATRGHGGPVFCFAGHTDVVPSGPLDDWRTDPFSPVIENGMLYGRGAADMKSGLAAMLTASEEFVHRYPDHQGTVAFLITSDEEGPSVDGTRRVVEVLRERQQTIDWCLVGEPSSEKALGDTIKIGRRGSLSGRLTVHGVQGHIAYPQFANNPVHALAPALAELTARTWDQGNDHFQPTSFQVSNISAGTGAPNVIPGELKARFNLRFSTEQTIETLKATVEGILAKHQVNFSLEWFISGYPFLTTPGALSDAAARAVHEQLGLRPKLSTGGGTSDGRFIAPMGAQVIELGVVNETIHKVNECVRVEDIDRLRQIYFRTLELLLAP